MKMCFWLGLVLLSLQEVWAGEPMPVPTDVARMVNFLRNPACNHFVRCTDNRAQIDFYYNGWRYRFSWEESDRSKKGVLIVWISPTDTDEARHLEIIGDENLNGKIDYGMNGSHVKENAGFQRFDRYRKIGTLESEAYWQKRYEEALRAAKATLPSPAQKAE
ncbi:MAG: hypothetical protein ABI747_00110 [Candidatus Moraniibacteriota bacterium]